MQADFLLDYDTLVINKPQKVHLMARFVTGPANIEDHDRRPLNISLVIDRSGSMAGQKIDFTRQAAQFLVQNLGSSDLLSIVLYNEQVETLLPPEQVRRKDAINQRIGNIKPSGTTNLSGGWLEGCNHVWQNLDENHLNRVIVISDGLANRGVTQTDELVKLARKKLEQGVSTTTMGLGRDFNEDLLMEMASAGGGAYYFIESPEVTPLIFQEELKGLLNVVGQNLTITVEPTHHLKFVSQLNAYAMHSDGNGYTFRLGDIFGDEVKALLMELSLDGLPATGNIQVATLRFEFDEILAQGTEHRILERPIMVDVRASVGEDEIVRVNPEVQQSMLLLKAAQARRTAVKAADKGQYRTAADSLREVADAIENSQVIDAELIEEQTALLQQADEMEKGANRYDEYSRKSMATQALYSLTSRHEATMMLRNRERERLLGKEPAEQQQPAKNQPSATGQNDPTLTDFSRDQLKLMPESVEPQPGVVPTHVRWKEQVFALDADLMRIGRAKHNEIVIPVKGVSRFHCQLRRVDGELLIEDVGSTNGTMLGSEQLQGAHTLSVGDIVYLCDEKLIFYAAGSQTDSE